MSQRKCSKCGHWNVGLDRCEKCNHVISLELQSKIERSEKLKKSIAKEPETLDKIHHELINSKFFIVRGTYFVLRSVWIMVVAFISFFIYAIAWTPG
ncbi:MAG: hypothetical protein ACPGEG_09345 [Salibacteraceae bacterium]